MPCLDEAGPGKQGQRQRLHEHEVLEDSNQLALVTPVSQNAGEGRDKEECCLAAESHEAEQPYRTTQAIGKPSHCHTL